MDECGNKKENKKFFEDAFLSPERQTLNAREIKVIHKNKSSIHIKKYNTDGFVLLQKKL